MTRMMILPLIGFLLCGIGGVIINSVSHFFAKLFALSGLYLGGSLMLLSTSSFQMCAALLICGIGCTVLIGTENHDPHPLEPADDIKVHTAFRLLLALALGILAYTVSERLRLWIPIRRNILFISVWLCLISLTGLSLDDDLLFRCIHLQCICLAFTLSYIYMESSVLVFACFAAINLLLAFGCGVLTNDRFTVSRDVKEDDQ